MIDVTILTLLGICAVAVARTPSPLLIVLLAFCGYLFTVDAVGALAADREEVHAFHVLALIFLGPSASPTRHAPPWLAPSCLTSLPPVALHGIMTVVATAAARLAFRRSAPLRPESALARRLDRVGFAFVSLAALSGMTVAVGLLVAFLVA